MHIFEHLDDVRGRIASSVVTIGNFDGVHRGHRALLGTTCDLARQQDATSCALTFWPHPRSVLEGGAPPLICTLAQKKAWIAETGIDALCIQPFDRDFAALEPETFLELIIDAFSARHLVLGHDFRFGRGGAGTFELAATFAARHGVDVTRIDEIRLGDEVVSSTSIREALLAGNVQRAWELLGRPWQVWGTHTAGAGRGRTLGYPTINLATDNELIVPDGVYGGRMILADGSRHVAAISVGTNPTFGNEPRHIEAFLFDCEDPDTQGELRLEFFTYVRAQVVFEDAARLIQQIEADTSIIRAQAEEQDWLSR
ncbi:MAG: riboflavin biosynthesis protein RibF [Candidatus Dadabacteria bacterium]|nr:MAG: riboflavin biosynthesis protein RibF [Candidatus Dadabacteria bacterium]